MSRRFGGYLLITSPDGPVRERDTVQCCHCGRHVEVEPGSNGQTYLVPDPTQPTGYRTEPGAFCTKCYGPLCLPCDADDHCVPLEERLRRMERGR